MTDEWMQALQGDVVEVARRLLDCELVRTMNGHEVVVRIVETEAYHARDAASHSFKGKTPRTAVLFGPPGHAYVYFTYGMHYCLNVVTGREGEGSAVLIRAVQPVQGTAVMRQLRPVVEDVSLTNGPAKLCQALGIDLKLNGHNLTGPPLQLRLKPAVPTPEITQTTRIGITKDTHRPWRFYIKNNPFISRA